MRKNPLNDKIFLEQLFTNQEREVYARITALTFNEMPIEYIEGKVTDGSVNIDGTSAVRRTCNLNLVAEEINIHDFYWGVKNKFKLELGLKNNIDIFYPDIIWFQQGIFVITQFNTSQTLNNWSIKISGKDKMCLLNGDISGNLPFNVDFAYEEYIDVETQKSTFTEIPIKDIIKRALIEFGKESEHNILINDIDEVGQELLEYRGIEPLYIFKDLNSEEYKQMSLKPIKCYYQLREKLSQDDYNKIPEKYSFLKEIYQQNEFGQYIFNQSIADSNDEYKNYNVNGWFEGTITDDFNIIYDNLLDNDEFEGDQIATEVRFNLSNNFITKRYSIIKIKIGDVPGYRFTNLVYGGELKANIGESITSVLDKIKNKFANFEYFYNVQGQFVFQKKREYISTKWNSTDEDNDVVQFNSTDEVLFNFIDNKLITSFQNSPKLTELKNDYSVWGSRDNLNLHMRYAIDNKPTEYKPIRVLKEEHIIITRDANGSRTDTKVQEKYYNAPEIEPYNTEGLLCQKVGYEVITLLENKDYLLNGLTNLDYDFIEKSLKATESDKLLYWLSLFVKEGVYYFFKGNSNDLKDMLYELDSTFTVYNNKVQMSFIPLPDGGEEWHMIYPYFAAYPYSTEDIYDIDANGKSILIHHKVDWRELIYQMALDYRKLNYTDDYFYYLKQENPWVLNNKTGYEQYYIDIEGFWRLLYNPNPSPVLDQEIKYTDVKNSTLLLDDYTENDIYDLIYIQDPYVKIMSEVEAENLTSSDIFRYSLPSGGNKSSIYPFAPSNACHLKKGTYFIKDQNNQEIMNPINCNDINENDSGYITLNAVSIDKIFIQEENEGNIRYVPFVEQEFNNINTLVNSTYYIKKQQKIPLSTLKQDEILWSLYYTSNLYTLSRYATECLSRLETLKMSKNENKYIQYAEDINSQLVSFITQMNSQDFQLIKCAFNNYFYYLVEEYKNNLIRILSEINESVATESCLSLLLPAYINNINNVILEYTNITIEKKLLENSQWIKTFNLHMQNLVNNIIENQKQVNRILDNEETLLKYNETFDSAQLVLDLETIRNALNNITDKYGETGQLYQTRAQINNLMQNITNGVISEEEISNSIDAIINNVKILQTTLDRIKEMIFFIFNDEIEEGTLKSIKELIVKINNLSSILNIPKNSIISIKNTVEDIAMFNNIPLLDIYNKIKTASNVEEANIILNDFYESTKDFQEHLIRYNVNNFNQINNNSFTSEPIHYYKARYTFNQDENSGNFWSLDIFEDPKTLIFWFDFLDPQASTDIVKYSVPAIGTRTKVVNDKNVKMIHHKEIPNIIFYNTPLENITQVAGYTYIHITNAFVNLFAVSSKGKTAKERIDELLYNHSYGQETVTLQAFPIYNLEPNHKIYINDTKSQIEGTYITTKITIPLGYKKMMSVTASKTVDSII